MYVYIYVHTYTHCADKLQNQARKIPYPPLPVSLRPVRELGVGEPLLTLSGESCSSL